MLTKFINWLSIGVVIASALAWLWWAIDSFITYPEVRIVAIIFFSISAFILLFMNGLKQIAKL